MAVNVVIVNGKTIINLADDTVTRETLAEGKTAHDKSGELIVGEMKGSALETVAQKDSTCTEDGYTEGVYCPCCARWVSGHEVIPAAHVDKDGDGVCDVCKTVLKTAIDSGEDGNIVWTYYESKTDPVVYSLEFSGSGVMTDYTASNLSERPWDKYKESAGEIVIAAETAKIGNRSCCEFSSATKATIGDSVTTIGDYAFSKCTKLSEVSFGENSKLETLNQYAFFGCTSLETIAFPGSLKTINTSAFASCTSLKTADFSKHESVPTLASRYTLPTTIEQIIVPTDLLDEWKAKTNWANFADKIVGV